MKNKVALVTGGSSGIGKAIAFLLAKNSYQVIILSRKKEGLKNVVDLAQEKKMDLTGISCDVRKEKEVALTVKNVLKKYHRIDVLINSAGIAFIGKIEETPLKKWQEVIDTNLKGIFLMTREVVPFMKRQNEGYIINIASNAGIKGYDLLSLYCASKFAVIGLGESLALELKEKNIRVTTLCPAGVDTPFWKKVAPTANITPQSYQRINPAGIAKIVLFLLENRENFFIQKLVIQPPAISRLKSLS